MRKIFAIAILTIKEEMRRKTLMLFLVFPPIALYASTIFVSFTPGYERSFVIDIALSSISFFAMLVSAFIASEFFVREEYQGTYYYFRTNPVRWVSVVAGKLLGGFIFVCFLILIMGLFSVGVIFLKFKEWDYNFIKAIILLPGQFMILLGFGMAGATIVSKYTNMIFVFLVYMLGHLTSYFEYLKEHSEGAINDHLIKIISKCIPDLTKFEARDLIVVGGKIQVFEILRNYEYAIFYLLILYMISAFIINKKTER